MQTDNRYALFVKLIEVFDLGCKYVNDYNAMLHDYNGTILYQAESQFINKIGRNPGITITELSVIYEKSVSACSQLNSAFLVDVEESRTVSGNSLD